MPWDTAGRVVLFNWGGGTGKTTWAMLQGQMPHEIKTNPVLVDGLYSIIRGKGYLPGAMNLDNVSSQSFLVLILQESITKQSNPYLSLAPLTGTWHVDSSKAQYRFPDKTIRMKPRSAKIPESAKTDSLTIKLQRYHNKMEELTNKYLTELDVQYAKRDDLPLAISKISGAVLATEGSWHMIPEREGNESSKRAILILNINVVPQYNQGFKPKNLTPTQKRLFSQAVAGELIRSGVPEVFDAIARQALKDSYLQIGSDFFINFEDFGEYSPYYCKTHDLSKYRASYAIQKLLNAKDRAQPEELEAKHKANSVATGAEAIISMPLLISDDASGQSQACYTCEPDNSIDDDGLEEIAAEIERLIQQHKPEDLAKNPVKRKTETADSRPSKKSKDEGGSHISMPTLDEILSLSNAKTDSEKAHSPVHTSLKQAEIKSSSEKVPGQRR